MEADEEGTLELLNALRRALVDPKIAEHRGRIVKTTGDGLLVEFGSVVDALRCATEVQAAMTERNADVPEDHRIEFRIDINMGDIVVEEGDIFGDGVNVAARLEGLAQRGGVCVSARVQEDAAGKLDLAFENTGEQQLRNIARPVRVYQVVSISRNAAVKPPLALPDKPSLAVLPFQNLSGDREQEYFADGVVEEIITAISRLPWLFVIARNSSFAYKGKSPDLRQVGRELGVRYVLEGSARKAGSRVRITGQLIDTTTGAHIWADHFDGALDDIFELRDQIASSVVGAIEPKLRQSEIERAARKPTESLDACDLYLRALALRHQYTETHSRGDGPARTSIGNRPVLRARGSDDRFLPGPPKSTRLRTGFGYKIAEAVRLARRAIETGKNDLDALWMGGFTLLSLAGERVTAANVIDRALTLNPNSAHAWMVRGLVSVFQDPDRTIAALDHAIRLSPVDPLGRVFASGSAMAHLVSGRYQQAIEWADRALAVQPDYRPALRMKVVLSAQLGRIEEARDLLRRVRELEPGLTIARYKASPSPPHTPPEIVAI
jgi:TolB-like protein